MARSVLECAWQNPGRGDDTAFVGSVGFGQDRAFESGVAARRAGSATRTPRRFARLQPHPLARAFTHPASPLHRFNDSTLQRFNVSTAALTRLWMLDPAIAARRTAWGREGADAVGWAEAADACRRSHHAAAVAKPPGGGTARAKAPARRSRCSAASQARPWSRRLPPYRSWRATRIPRWLPRGW
jgi:hypothetical protein